MKKKQLIVRFSILFALLTGGLNLYSECNEVGQVEFFYMVVNEDTGNPVLLDPPLCLYPSPPGPLYKEYCGLTSGGYLFDDVTIANAMGGACDPSVGLSTFYAVLLPLGDAPLVLIVLAGLYCSVIYYRRRKCLQAATH